MNILFLFLFSSLLEDGKNVSLMYLKFNTNGMKPNAAAVYADKYPNSPIRPQSNIAEFNTTIFTTEFLCLDKKSVNLSFVLPSCFKKADNVINIKGVVIAQSKYRKGVIFRELK